MNLLDFLPARKPRPPQRHSSNAPQHLIYRPARRLAILHIFPTK